jgi:hypothetical protein
MKMPEDAPREMSFAIPMEHHWPDGIITRYANQFTMQITEGLCYLGFYEATPPIWIGTPEEIRAKAEQMTSIRAEGVARIVVTTAKMQEILAAIHSALDRSVAASPPDSSSERPPQ